MVGELEVNSELKQELKNKDQEEECKCVPNIASVGLRRPEQYIVPCHDDFQHLVFRGTVK